MLLRCREERTGLLQGKRTDTLSRPLRLGELLQADGHVVLQDLHLDTVAEARGHDRRYVLNRPAGEFPLHNKTLDEIPDRRTGDIFHGDLPELPIDV